MSGSRLKHLKLRAVGLGACEACGVLFARAGVLCGVCHCASRGVARGFRFEGLERTACEVVRLALALDLAKEVDEAK